MGSIYKRNNIWWVDYYYEGKRERKSTKTKLKSEAQKILTYIESQIIQGQVPFLLNNETTLQTLSNLMLIDYKNKKKRVENLSPLIARIHGFFGEERKVCSINTQSILDFIEFLRGQGLANATINRHLTALRRMFNIGKNQKPKLVAETPTIETLPEDNAKQGFVEVDIFFEFRSLIAPYLRDFITTAYEFGMRSGELKQLKWDHVDRNGWCINLPGTITKNKKGRTIPLTTELKRRFQELWEYKQKKGIKLPFVFLNKNESGPMGDFRDDWNEVCRKLGIGYGYKTSKDYVEQWEKTFKPGPTLHDLRRSAVINNDRAGLSSAVNRNIIGHLTPEMFDRYRIVPFSDLENGMKQLEAYKKSRLNEYSKAKKEKQR